GRVNAVSLGVIKTPDHDPASYDGLAALHPLGRVGEVSDVVDAILYLERATFVTGETLHVDGGQAAGRYHQSPLTGPEGLEPCAQTSPPAAHSPTTSCPTKIASRARSARSRA